MRLLKCKYCQASFQIQSKAFKAGLCWFIIELYYFQRAEGWRQRQEVIRGGLGLGSDIQERFHGGPELRCEVCICLFVCVRTPAYLYLLTIIYLVLQWDNQEPSEGLVQAADPGGGGVLQRARDSRGRGPHGQPQEDAGECQILCLA